MPKKEMPHLLFADLTSDETKQLCYISYYGEDFGSAIPQYLKYFRKSRKTYDETVFKLQERGYLLTHNTAMPEHHLDILDYLATEHSDWLEQFKSFRQYSPTRSCEYLWRLADLLRKDDFEAAARLAKPYAGLGSKLFNVYAYIRNRMVTDSRYARLLTDEQVYTMTAETLEDLLHRDMLDENALDSIRKLPSASHPQYHEIMERIDLYEFFVTGIYTVYESPRSLWGLSMNAIKEFYEGNVENALALFREAVMTQGKKTASLPIPLLNYFFALCILRYRLKYGQLAIPNVLNDLRSSSPVRANNDHFAARLLLEYAEVTTEGEATDLQKHAYKVMGYADNELNRQFAYLLGNYFALPKEQMKQVADVVPNTKIMMHEMSAYMALSTKTKESLTALYGGKPLLSSIRRKSSWEILLGEIDTSVHQGVDTRARRIIYFLKGMSLSSIVEQVQQEDGSWVNDRLLSQNVLCCDGYESMDLHDSHIAMQLSKAHSGADDNQQVLTDAEMIVPNLVGTDRVFYGVEYLPDRHPVEIISDVPYVEFNGQGDKIVISSNAQIGPDGLPKKHTVTKSADKDRVEYHLVTLNPIQRDVLFKLLSRKSLPASAAPTLRKTIESLKGIMEVRENILSNVVMKAFESEGYIVVRIEPVDDHKISLGREYRLSFFATPLSKGLSRLIPATGEEYVYDEDEAGQTHCVHRNMEQEGANFQMLVDFADQFSLEFNSYNVCTLGDERTLLCFLAFLHKNQDRFLVEWPNGQILKFKGILTDKNVDIEVKSDTDWFSIEGDVRLGGEHMTLDELLAACCNDSYDGFVRIGEHEYLQMTETLRKHIAELDAVLKMGEKRKLVPKFQIGALATTLEQMNSTTDSGYRDFMLKMKEAYSAEIPLPECLNAQMRPYQEEGYKWMRRLDAWGAGACLADDMGLGKTLQSIAFVLSKSSDGSSLVIGPKSVIPNWENEIAKFAPQLKHIVLNDASDRNRCVNDAGPFDVVLCTYGVLTTEAELLASKDWNVVCLDEAQQIKNRNTHVSQAAMNLKSKSRIILTGTPLQNHVGELWNLMQFINPGLLGKWSVFRDTYVNANLDEEHRNMLKELTQPFMLRRTKQQVLHDLPEKIEGTHYVTLTENEAKVYEELRHRVELKFKKGKTKAEKLEAETIEVTYFEELMKLRLISCDMHLVYDRWKEPSSSKIKALMEIMETLMDVSDNNILIFSQFTSFLDRIKPEIEQHGWDYHYMDGQTPMKKRQTMVEQFQDGEKRIFISSLKAGGLGVNLTRANYVILLDPWWNPAIENQATDRAHRIGQKRCVSVIRLISQHTIEEKILRLHEKKQSISDDVLDGTSESYKLTYEDILDMVSPY